MSIEEMAKMLPEALQKEVKDFIQSLLEKRTKRHTVKPKFDWAGALRDLKGEYSSVQL